MPREGNCEVRAEGRSETDADEDEAGFADVEAARAYEDDGKRLEHCGVDVNAASMLTARRVDLRA